MEHATEAPAGIVFGRFLVLPHRRELLADGRPVPDAPVEVDVDEMRETILRALDRLAAAQREEGGDPGDEPRTITEVPTAVELVEREAAAAAARPKAEYAPGSLEYQALHPDWTPQED